MKRLASKIPGEAFVRLDIKWERPFDVSAIRELLDVKYLYVRTRFERKLRTVKGGEVPRPNEYFSPIELRAIEMTGEKKLENVDAVVELFLGGWKEEVTKPEEKPPEEEKRNEKRKEKTPDLDAKPEEKTEKKSPRTKPGKGSNLLAWLGGGK